MIDVAHLATNIQPNGEGIWFSRNQSPVSHPEECQDWYHLVEDRSYWFAHRASAIVQCLRNLPPAGPLLDVGGGSGHVTQAIRRAGYDAVVLEPSEQGARHALERGLAPVICSTLENAGLVPGSVPAVGLFDVLEHIEEDLGFLRSLRELLVEGGRLYMTVPAYNALWSNYDEMVGHFRRYTIGSLERRLQAAGLKLELATYLFAFLPPPIFLLRSLPSRLHLARASRVERFQKEHATGRSVIRKTIDWLLRQELKTIRNKRRIPFGSSCLAVARAA